MDSNEESESPVSKPQPGAISSRVSSLTMLTRDWLRKHGHSHASSLHLDRQDGRLQMKKGSLGQVLYNAARLMQVINNFWDHELIDKYLLGDPPIHPRRTLDQFYYRVLKNTSSRDRDQVVYKRTSIRYEDLHHCDMDIGQYTRSWTSPPAARSCPYTTWRSSSSPNAQMCSLILLLPMNDSPCS